MGLLMKQSTTHSDCSIATSISSATDELLNTADTASTKTAAITVVSLNPLEVGLFIRKPTY